MGNQKDEAGPFQIILAWLGFFAGLAAGSETGEFGPAIIGGVILAAIGAAIGKFTDELMAKLIFLAMALIAFLINSAIRNVVWQILAEVIGS